MQKIETIVRTYLARLVHGSDSASVDLMLPMAQGLGISSLDMVILITSACKEAKVPMTMLTEQDISTIRTGQELVNMLMAKLVKIGETHALA
ncbi:acyl carrier protein [Oxalobacteraceae bacterium GrIS 1.11]